MFCGQKTGRPKKIILKSSKITKSKDMCLLVHKPNTKNYYLLLKKTLFKSERTTAANVRKVLNATSDRLKQI